MKTYLYAGAMTRALMDANAFDRGHSFGRKDGGAGQGGEPDIKALAAQMKTATDEVKRFAEASATEMKRLGDVTAETKANADQALAKQSDILAQLADVEQKLARRPGGDPDAVKSMGQQVSGSDTVKSFAANGAKGSIRIEVKAITSASNSAGGLIAPDRRPDIVDIPRRDVRIRDLLMPGRTASNVVQYARQTARTNNAAVVAEGAAKPESGYIWAQDDANVRTIAHWVPVSRQAMDDAPQLETIIDGELTYGLDLAEDGELLNGDGTGEHLHGLVPQATAYAAPFAPANATAIDTLRLALLQATLADYQADGIVLHPTDWARIELTKDSTGRYIWANPTAVNQKTLWGRAVVDTTSMGLDKFLVGAFRAAGQIFDRMDTEVLISSEDRDNFIKNMLTVRAERRLALAVRRPTALIYGDLGFVA